MKKLGGYPTPADAGINLETRDTLYERICDLGEGAIFSESEIATTSKERDDFAAMRGYDYHHVIDGYCTGIVETKYLRRSPRLPLFLASYCNLRNCTLSESGDRIAWTLRLKEWEPLKGYRYYSDGPEEVLAFGRIKIRTMTGSPWLLDDTGPARIFRAFLDLDPKERQIAFQRRRNLKGFSDEDMRSTIEWAQAADVKAGLSEFDPDTLIAEMQADLRMVKDLVS